jgi:peptidoglycan/LPS O-acetylase OafA/YrhL
MRATTLYNLHLLRVIAALSVVYFHMTSTAGLGLKWDVGSRGVDVFFVISGFIIAYIGSVKPEQFFVRRLIRVVPFYWAATLCVFVMVATAPRLFRSATSDVPHLVASLLFVPHLAPNGETMPTLLLGWSLNFEVFFYLLFALGLQLSPKWSPAICVASIVTFVLAVHAAATDSTLLTFYARPIVLEFCYGIGVFYLFRWCSGHAPRLARLAVLKWLLVFVLVGSFVALVVLERYFRDAIPRHLIAGIPSFFIVTSALLLERIYGVATNNRLVYLVGESSYIIYLVHPYVVFTVLRVVVKDASSYSTPALFVLIVGLLVLTSAIAIGIHVWFEKPVMAFLRARLSSPA